MDGTEVRAWFDRQDWLREHDLLATVYRTAPDLELTQHATRNGSGWELTRQLLIRATGLRCTIEVDPLLAALTGDCDGTQPLREHLARLATTHDLNPTELETDLIPPLTHLIERGILTPANLNEHTQAHANRSAA